MSFSVGIIYNPQYLDTASYIDQSILSDIMIMLAIHFDSDPMKIRLNWTEINLYIYCAQKKNTHLRFRL